jgi:hypothetical protein
MPPTPLPPNDHIVRYARKRLLLRDENEAVVGVLPQAFELRDSERYLSVTWLQYFSNDYELGLADAAAAIGRQLKVKPNDGFTTGCVRTVKDICAKCDARVRILHEPSRANKGYSAWRGIPRDNQDLFNLLASDAFVDTRLASSIAKPSAPVSQNP